MHFFNFLFIFMMSSVIVLLNKYECMNDWMNTYRRSVGLMEVM